MSNISPEDIDRVCSKLARLWKQRPTMTLGELLHESSHQGVLARHYGWTRTDRWCFDHEITNAQFEKCLDDTLNDQEKTGELA